jgi:hypothetical protein
MRMPVSVVAVVAVASLLASAPGHAQQPAATVSPAPVVQNPNAKTWLGHADEIEAFIRTAVVTEVKPIGTGVTGPKKARFAPGGPVDKVAWKVLAPGMRQGYYESYKSEIAAYELDKFLGLDMVPPSVERVIDKDTGVAVMWVSPTKSFKELGGVPTPPAVELSRWNRQLSRAKLFHNLVGNLDPNLGNWLVDPAWNLVLIDHSRAFTGDTRLVHEMTRVDAELWARMRALDEPTLKRVLDGLVGPREIRAILARRDRIQRGVDDMARELGDAMWIR